MGNETNLHITMLTVGVSMLPASAPAIDWSMILRPSFLVEYENLGVPFCFWRTLQKYLFWNSNLLLFNQTLAEKWKWLKEYFSGYDCLWLCFTAITDHG